MRAKLVSAAALLVVAAAAGPARAQGSPQVRDARRHMEVGQEYYLQERWEESAGEFLAAFALRQHPAFLYNAAMAFHQHGAAARAVELYEQYLVESPAARDRDDVEERVALLRRAVAAGVRITPEPACEGPDCPEPAECLEGESCPDTPDAPTVPEVRIERVELDPEAAAAARTAVLRSVILVESEPGDASIALLDAAGVEQTRGQAPLEHTADPGSYTLVLEHPEYRTVTIPVQVRAGRYYVFHIEMSQPPAFLSIVANVPGALIYIDDRAAGAAGQTPFGDVVRTGEHTIWVERPGYQTVERRIEIGLGQQQEIEVELERLPIGTLRLLANVEGATVEVDGEVVGTAPVEDLVLEPGEHRLRVRARGMKDHRTTFEVRRGQTTRVLVRLNPSPSRTSAWVTLAFSAVTFAGAGIVGWQSTLVFRELEELRDQGRLVSDDGRFQRGTLLAAGADLGFFVGTVMAALTLYYFLRDPLPPSEGRIEDPVDFTENPELPGPTATDGGGEAALVPPPSTGRGASAASRLRLTAGGLELRF